MKSIFLRILFLIIIVSCSVQGPTGPATGSDCVVDDNGVENCSNIDWDVDEDGDITISPLPQSDPDTVPPPTPKDNPPWETEENSDDFNPELPPSSEPSTSKQTSRGIDLSDFFEDLSDGLGELGEKLVDGFGDVFSTDSPKKKKERIEDKIRRAESNALKAEGYLNGIRSTLNDINKKHRGSNTDTVDSNDVQNILNLAGMRHNAGVKNFIDSLPPLDNESPDDNNNNIDNSEDCLLRFKKCVDLTPEDLRVKEAREYNNFANQFVESKPNGTVDSSRKLIALSEKALDIAEQANNAGDTDSGGDYTDIGLALTDAAISFIPVVGWANDVVQAVSGVNPITGEELDSFDRTMATLGALSGGILSKFGKAKKIAKILDDVSDSSEIVNDGNELKKSLEKAKDFVDSVRDIPGLPDDPEKVKNLFKSANNGKWNVVFDNIQPSNFINNPRMMKKLRQDTGIPGNWDETITQDGKGLRFAKPGTNRADELRIMPPNQNLQYETSKVSNVRLKKDGKWRDKDGNVVDRRSDESHIPFERFDFPDWLR